MKRMFRVLAVAALVAMIMVASISPAMAKRVAGGQGLSTEAPCHATEDRQDDRVAGAHLDNDPPGDRTGCWVLLPYD